jgi:predicted lipoprotein with Yx(FWY)xxD motif
MFRTRILPLTAAAVAALALSGCGFAGGGVGAPGSGGFYGATTAPAAPAAPQPAGVTADAPQPALTAKEVDDLGTIVVDQDGYTLYRFDEDTADPPSATCVGACADTWPPFVVDRTAKLRITGVADSAIGLVERPDGTTQLTIEGWAVYRFSGDTAPGATEGQGMAGTWYAITPDGGKATPA